MKLLAAIVAAALVLIAAAAIVLPVLALAGVGAALRGRS